MKIRRIVRNEPVLGWFVKYIVSFLKLRILSVNLDYCLDVFEFCVFAYLHNCIYCCFTVICCYLMFICCMINDYPNYY